MRHGYLAQKSANMAQIRAQMDANGVTWGMIGLLMAIG